MSLVPTYVQSQDGMYYKNPVIRLNGYYVCWDDDDPIEIVIEKRLGQKHIHSVLNRFEKAGWRLRLISHKPMCAGRVFGKSWDFRPAMSYFVEQTHGAPPAEFLSENEGVCSTPEACGQSVIYLIAQKEAKTE